MKKGLFITGTSTGVGKTVISAIICRILVNSGRSIVYYKPVQTGLINENDKDIAPDCRFVENLINDFNNCMSSYTYLFKKPASPHLAARLEGAKIKISKILNDYNNLCKDYDFIIVEGAGGLYVPLNDELDLVSDIPKMLNLNIVMVADAGLGTINHVSLSFKFIQSLQNHLSGIILIYHGEEPTDIEIENLSVLKKITGLNNIYLFPAVKNIDTENNIQGDILEKIKFFPDIKIIEKWINE